MLDRKIIGRRTHMRTNCVRPLSWRPVPLGQLGPHLYSTPERNAAGSANNSADVVIKPYVMLGFNAFVADSDEEAQSVIAKIKAAL